MDSQLSDQFTMANKTMKTTLHLCVVSLVRHNTKLRAYFCSKNRWGKNKMPALNAVRNKLEGDFFSTSTV